MDSGHPSDKTSGSFEDKCSPVNETPFFGVNSLGDEGGDFSQTVAFTPALATDFAAVEESAPVRKDYAVGEELARGGMGRIYLATDPTLQRSVARIVRGGRFIP
jgi:hypothetical protein